MPADFREFGLLHADAPSGIGNLGADDRKSATPKSESQINALRQARLVVSHAPIASAIGTVTAASPKSVMTVQFNPAPIPAFLGFAMLSGGCTLSLLWI